MIETYLEGGFDVFFEHAGLVMWHDPYNYIKVIRDTAGSQSVVVFTTVDGVSSSHNRVPYDNDWIYLRLERFEGLFRAFYSADGISWEPLLELTDIIGPISQIGILAVSTPVGNVFRADFDYFRTTLEPSSSAPWTQEDQASPLELELVDRNPVTDGVTAVARTARAGPLRAEVVDPGGRVLRVLDDRWRPQGTFTIHWDGRDERGISMASGVYWLRLRTSNAEVCRKLLLME